jgi:hypothetical protein
MYEQNSISDIGDSISTDANINTDPFLSESDAAAYLHVSLATLRRRRYQGAGPRFIHVGEIRYRRSWLEDYVLEQLEQKQTAKVNRPDSGAVQRRKRDV